MMLGESVTTKAVEQAQTRHGDSWGKHKGMSISVSLPIWSMTLSSKLTMLFSNLL